MKNKAEEKEELVIPFRNIALGDVKKVGGKNASLGEMFLRLSSTGIKVPDGFATTAHFYRVFISDNGFESQLRKLLSELDIKTFSNLTSIGKRARDLVLSGSLQPVLKQKILDAYRELSMGGAPAKVAVRSSATAEDLPAASFAGQHESYLNIEGDVNLLDAVQKCFASLFTDRAIKYREDNGFKHMDVALSVGVQKMVRSDLACSGVAFTLEPESGFSDTVLISGAWGLGENIVQGTVTPDEFLVFKPTLKAGKKALVSSKIGSKSKTMVYSDEKTGQAPTVNIDTPAAKRDLPVLNETEITTLARCCVEIESHYKLPMDIEWAKDGSDGQLYILQARPETVQSRKPKHTVAEYQLQEKGIVLTKGEAVGTKIISGTARRFDSIADAKSLKEGEIIVTETTSPDWDPILKKAGGIITDKGGRTSHASIVARELGTAAVVGTSDATSRIKDGQLITISCAEGKTGYIYEGALQFTLKEHDLRNIVMPKTDPMLIIGDPNRAFQLSFYPHMGVGLMRLEFIINSVIKIHPMALVNFDNLKDTTQKPIIAQLTRHYTDKKKYFVDNLAQAVATIACAFYPKAVIARMSDFKTNEYANLLGGKEFEPVENNAMLGFRGASRYYHENYREGFRLECEAMKVVRDEMGLTNVKLMIPFCRTPEEGKKVTDLMATYGLKRGVNGLEILVMAEIPSNALLAEQFAKLFDGFSIGSNDLTQLTLGVDRDSALLSDLFDEQNEASKQMITMIIEKAKTCGIPVGLCGQAPSDHPEFARFLVEQGINSISFNPDALLAGIKNIQAAESAPVVEI